MDQFSAHLDRGWDLIQRGDARGAEVSARRALELDSDSPEAYNLLGYVAALNGDFEDAAESYQQAIALDDTYVEAILNAAEIHIHPLGEYSEAERLCDEALGLADTDEERVDALLLKFDALLGRGESEQAKALCDRFPPGPYESPAQSFLVGRAFYEVGNIEHAAPLIEQATKASADNAEAFYYLGLVKDEQGLSGEATEAFLRSRDLDLALDMPSWSLSPDTFRTTVERAVAGLDPELRGLLGKDSVFIASVPGVEVIVDGVDPRALLLIDAVSIETDAEATASKPPVARLFVYQRNVERLAGAVELIAPEIESALSRELRNHFLEAPSEQAKDGPTVATASNPPTSAAAIPESAGE